MARFGLAFALAGTLAACGSPPGTGPDDEAGDTGGTDADTSDLPDDGGDEGPVPIECEAASGEPGQHRWTYAWAGPAGYEDEARGIDVDGTGQVIVGGITRSPDNGEAWIPWFSVFELDGTQLWSRELEIELGETHRIDDVAWVGPGAFMSAGASTKGPLLTSYSGQAEVQWEDQRIVAGTCDPATRSEAFYVDLSVGAMGLAVGMFAFQTIGNTCSEVDSGVEMRSLAGDVLWSENLLFAMGEPRVAVGDGILFAAAGEWFYGFDGEGTPLWTSQDVPEANGLAIGRSGKLVTHRFDDDSEVGYVAERDASGGVVWELPFFTGADDRRITDMAIDPCDDSIVFVGAQAAEVWVQKLDASGEEQWSTTLDLVADANDTALAITIAGDATVLIAGRQGETLQSDLFVAAFEG